MHPVCTPGPWCLSGDPNPFCLLILLLGVHAGVLWLGLSSQHGYKSHSGFHLMCSNSFPAAAPSLARHTGKSLPLLPHLYESSQRTRYHQSLIPLRGKQEGRRELVKCPLVSLQSHFSCCFRTHHAHMCGGIHRNIDLFLVELFLCLCWANVTLG